MKDLVSAVSFGKVDDKLVVDLDYSEESYPDAGVADIPIAMLPNSGKISLLQMDAADLQFAGGTFDIVYAPYLISVVPEPATVAREMRRVCRPGGRIVFLNHFLSASPLVSRVERLISPLTVHVGFKADIDLAALLAQADLEPASIEKVNFPRIWSLVTCVRD